LRRRDIERHVRKWERGTLVGEKRLPKRSAPSEAALAAA
jgi:hypothetical protein